MFGSTTLDVVTGLVFIYLLYSLLTTTIQEGIASLLRLRAKMLVTGIKRMLNDSDGGKFADEFLGNPIIKYLADKDGKSPSYITAQNFSLVLTQIMKEGQVAVSEAEKINSFISTSLTNLNTPNAVKRIEPETLKAIKTFWDNANNDVTVFKTNLENWFDDTMDRVSGWYKRRTQLFMLIIGFILAVCFNVDSINIAKKLSVDKDARANLVKAATAYDQNHKNDTGKNVVKPNATLSAINDSLFNDVKNSQSILGLGNTCAIFSSGNSGKIFLSIAGWLITALAISLGAPFWFDLLQKVISLRGTGDTPEEKAKKKAALKKT